jgi:threonine dehydratase
VDPSGGLRGPDGTDDAEAPSFVEVKAAATHIDALVHHTPVLTSGTLDELAGASLFFKCEHLQRAGAFKFRGATNAVRSLDDDEAARGVAAHSSGNHAAALALAARERGIPAHVVMPTTAPAVKRAAVEAYGAHVIWCEPTMASRQSTLAEVVRQTGATEIHPFDNAAVIAGAGTAALELLDEIDGLDLIVAPVGGGGLLSGTAIATRAFSPTTRVIGGEPASVDDAYRSMRSGTREDNGEATSIADGLLTALSDRTFAIIRANVDEIVPVAEQQIVDAMRLIYERLKQVVEPSAAVALAAVLALPVPRPSRIGIILSGGNVDLDRLPF